MNEDTYQGQQQDSDGNQAPQQPVAPQPAVAAPQVFSPVPASDAAAAVTPPQIVTPEPAAVIAPAVDSPPLAYPSVKSVEQSQPMAPPAAPQQPSFQQGPQYSAQPPMSAAMEPQANGSDVPQTDVSPQMSAFAQQGPVPAQPQPQQSPQSQQPATGGRHMVGQLNQPGYIMPQRPKRKILVPAVVGGLLFAFVLAGVAYLRFFNTPLSYASSDLSSYTTGSYDAAAPKQWSDITGNTEFQKAFFGAEDTSDMQDLKINAYKYNAASQSADSFMITASSNSGLSDDDLRKALADTDLKKSFEANVQGVVDQMSEDSAVCSSVENKKSGVTYDTPRYVMQVDMSMDCVVKHDKASLIPDDRAHMYVQMGAANARFYIAMVVTGATDWTSNRDFYQSELLPALKPKS